jgi:hypothetical protein
MPPLHLYCEKRPDNQYGNSKEDEYVLLHFFIKWRNWEKQEVI